MANTSGTLSLKNGSGELALKIAEKIKKSWRVQKMWTLIDFLEDFEKHRLVGVNHSINEDGLVVFRERKIDDIEFEFYKQFKGLII